VPAWASPEIEIIAAASLIQLANHFKGTQVLSRPQPKILEVAATALDLADIKLLCARFRQVTAVLLGFLHVRAEIVTQLSPTDRGPAPARFGRSCPYQARHPRRDRRLSSAAYEAWPKIIMGG
jgi:hypothetical protein